MGEGVLGIHENDRHNHRDTYTGIHPHSFIHYTTLSFFPFSHNHALFFSRHHANKKGFFTPSRTQKQSFTNHAWRSITQARNNFFHFRAITQQQRAIHAITHTYGGTSNMLTQNALRESISNIPSHHTPKTWRVTLLQ